MKSPPSACAGPSSRAATGTPAAASASPRRAGSAARIGFAIRNSTVPAPVTSPGSRTYVASTRPSAAGATATSQPRSASSCPNRSCWRASRSGSGARQSAPAKSPVTDGRRGPTSPCDPVISMMVSCSVPGSGPSGIRATVRSMAATSDPAETGPTLPDEPTQAQFGPHRFYPGEGGGSEQFRGARFDVADLRGARFTDCDLTGVTIRDGWLVDVSISGYLENVTVNGVDVSEFVSAELDRRHPERVQFREGRTADDVRAIWDTIERLWAGAAGRAERLPAAAKTQQVSEEWSFAQTLRHLVFITDAWASRTVLDEERPYHPLGLPQSWYPAADAAALGIDLSARPDYAEILAARAGRMAVM